MSDPRATDRRRRKRERDMEAQREKERDEAEKPKRASTPAIVRPAPEKKRGIGTWSFRNRSS
jgi:hypothetical protein